MATSWTDEGASSPAARVSADITKVRAIHVNELRTAINAEIVSRGGVQQVWTNDPITSPPGVAQKVRTVHVAELRSASNYAKTLYCVTDATPVTTWADDPLIAGTTKIRAVHINELRAYINLLEGACKCNCNGHCGCNGLCCNCDHCGSHCAPH
jgi:hypothetical protein